MAIFSRKMLNAKASFTDLNDFGMGVASLHFILQIIPVRLLIGRIDAQLPMT
jgi:hypothetical protein